ncbi:NirA family protein [Roseomonas elaeocarpi]|uniref:NirA family protein n=1 Tax=Roseomonas elaeocarpi TaxID=907779 RepID=A0ABV6JN82_9PROT
MQDSFTEEQQQYVKGFFAGIDARGALLPNAEPADAAPPDALRAAQKATMAAGGKLVPQEEVKAEKHPLDRWDELVGRADAGRFPKALEDFVGRYHGLFYVAPAQDSFMCRLRIPGGILSPWQLRGIADIAEELGGGHADVTTRANLQIREIGAAHGPEVVMRLGDLGLLPRGTGADNIRNITASPTAGIDAAELVDTRAVVRKLHHHIMNTRDLFALPRKFNIAFNGGGAVEVLEETNDISFHAVRVLDGFGVPAGLYYRLNLGGITGHQDFARETGVVVPLEDAVRVADAVLRVFIAHGDRTDRKKARLKYLLDRWGLPKFITETEALLGAALPKVPAEALAQGVHPAKHGHVGVHAQKQAGLFYVGVVTPLGRLSAAQWRGVADIAGRISGEIRLTVWQNFLLSGVPEARVPEVVAALAELGLSTKASHIRGGLVACTGNAGCKFAASNTKKHAAELADYLDARLVMPHPINIHLTGCHNSCAQHYVGDIGLLGAKVERGEELVEGYDLHVGGGAGVEQKIGRLIRPKVAHDELGPLVAGLLGTFLVQRREGESFHQFCARHDEAALDAMLGESVA